MLQDFLVVHRVRRVLVLQLGEEQLQEVLGPSDARLLLIAVPTWLPVVAPTPAVEGIWVSFHRLREQVDGRPCRRSGTRGRRTVQAIGIIRKHPSAAARHVPHPLLAEGGVHRSAESIVPFWFAKKSGADCSFARHVEPLSP